MALLVIWLAIIMLAPVAQAHSVNEIDEWEDNWHERVLAEGELTVALALEWRDWALRHPWYYMPEPHHIVENGSDGGEPASAPQSASSRGMGAGVEQWRDLVASYFPAGQVDTALAVMACESGGNPSAKNPRSSARGLFQILGSLWAPHFGISQDALYDPATNVRLAAEIWRQSGWTAWSAYNRGCR